MIYDTDGKTVWASKEGFTDNVHPNLILNHMYTNPTRSASRPYRQCLVLESWSGLTFSERINSMILCSPSPGVYKKRTHTHSVRSALTIAVNKQFLHNQLYTNSNTHLMTRQVDSDILPQPVSGELVVDKILEVLLESRHELSPWK